MQTISINFPAIKQAAAKLKLTYPRKRGVVMRISAARESGYGMSHLGYAVWDGSLQSLTKALAELLGPSPGHAVTTVRLHATHMAISVTEHQASVDITALVLREKEAA